jgi:hypothetical protein
MIQKKYKKWIGSIILIPLILLFIGRRIVFTQSSTNYQIQKQVIDQAGAASQSNSYQVFDAVGQPSPVRVTSSNNYIVSSGFLGGGIIVSAVTETDDVAIPDEFKLCQNYPNPFNPETAIEYRLPGTSDVILTIYDLQGHQVRRLVNGTKSAGYYKIQWDGRSDAGQKSASGIYFCRIHAKTYNSDPHTYIGCKKMLLMK